MIFLIITSLIWAFSFGLIKSNLTSLDSNFVSFIRMLISFLVFLPFLRFKDLNGKLIAGLILLGMVQFGIMYMAYIYSYQYLNAYEIAVFTIFTPIYVTLFSDLLQKIINRKNLLASIIAVVGSAVILYKKADIELKIIGFLFIQISNACFAVGQIIYKNFRKKNHELEDRHVFGLLYLGAVIITFLASTLTVDWNSIIIEKSQIFTLLYLGVVASSLGFFLWNLGATKTSTGSLAVLNNLKIPLAVIVSILFFSERADTVTLVLGLILITTALFISENSFYINKHNKSNS